MKPKVLFILKKRHTYDLDTNYSYSMSSGLFNSAKFVSDMLNKNGVNSKIVEVNDANGIDKEVYQFKPDYVILEALWCPPTKFKELIPLHKNVKWIIRIHSEIPFLANEGIAIDWIEKYMEIGKVFVSFNSKRTNEEFKELYPKYKNKIIYLPNYYQLNISENKKISQKDIINIGCFGAIRPMKNQLIQAVAAIKFANNLGKKLHFHINVGRTEQKGESVLKNLEALFDGSKHKLIKHQWMPQNEFIEVIKKMDIGMQVSMSETYNIVSANFVNNEIPVVVSKEVEWVFPLFYADTTDSDNISSKLKLVWYTKWFKLYNLNKIGLYFSSLKSKKIWLKTILKKQSWLDKFWEFSEEIFLS